MTQPENSPDFEAAQQERRDEHLAALGTSAAEQPDMTDPEQWRDAPKEGGGA
ncbi:MAG TPA: hypothetical protein VFR07_03925 [Mycobacteriales bacterium]|jgi:hypothetical protein|nr:hypothetical protein [Mycobacteriales bacterium]